MLVISIWLSYYWIGNGQNLFSAEGVPAWLLS